MSKIGSILKTIAGVAQPVGMAVAQANPLIGMIVTAATVAVRAAASQAEAQQPTPAPFPPPPPIALPPAVAIQPAATDSGLAQRALVAFDQMVPMLDIALEHMTNRPVDEARLASGVHKLIEGIVDLKVALGIPLHE